MLYRSRREGLSYPPNLNVLNFPSMFLGLTSKLTLGRMFTVFLPYGAAPQGIQLEDRQNGQRKQGFQHYLGAFVRMIGYSGAAERQKTPLHPRSG